MTKNRSSSGYFGSVFSHVECFKKTGEYMIRFRIEWVTKWYEIYFGNQFLNPSKSENTAFAHGQKCQSSMVFGFFRTDFGCRSKCQICRFVAPLTSFRMLSDSNRKRARKVEKKVKNTFLPILTFFFGIFDGCFRSIHSISTTTWAIALIFWIILWVTMPDSSM